MEKISIYVSYIRNLLRGRSSDRNVLEIERPQTKGLELEYRQAGDIVGYDLESNPGFDYATLINSPEDDGTPYYSTEYLVRKELKMTEDEIEANKKW